MTTLERLENQLGNSLQLLRDKLDLQVRQGDKETISALQDLTFAWQDLALLMKAERQASIKSLPFILKAGSSQVDALMDYAIREFPFSLSAKRLDLSTKS